MGCKRVLSFFVSTSLFLSTQSLLPALEFPVHSIAKTCFFLPRDTVFNYRTLPGSPQEYDMTTQTLPAADQARKNAQQL